MTKKLFSNNEEEMYSDDPKFPHIKVKLINEDGNAFAIMARVSHAMKKNGCTKEEIDEYFRDSKSGDYDHLLQVACQTVDVY